MSLLPSLCASAYKYFETNIPGQGIPSAAFYWWIASLADALFVTPIFLIIGLVMLCRILLLRNRSDKSQLLTWNITGLIIGVAGEIAISYFLPKFGC
jgi:hypothetical protein